MAQDLTYELINRQCFEYHSLKLYNRGWSIFPQTQDRKPASVDYKMINPIGEHNLDTRMPLLSDIERWNRKCGNQNLACMMGPGSGRAIAVDIDVLDEAKSEAAQALAKEILGYASVAEARVGRSRYLNFYNGPRPHSSLAARTPDQAYFTQALLLAAAGKIRDRYLGLAPVGYALLAQGQDTGLPTINPAELPLIESESVFKQTRPPLNIFNLNGKIIRHRFMTEYSNSPDNNIGEYNLSVADTDKPKPFNVVDRSDNLFSQFKILCKFCFDNYAEKAKQYYLWKLDPYKSIDIGVPEISFKR